MAETKHKTKTTRKRATKKKAARKKPVVKTEDDPKAARFLEVAPGEHLHYPQQLVPTQPGARYRGGAGTVVDAGMPYEETLLAGQHRKLIPSTKRKATPFNSPAVQRWADQFMQKITGSEKPTRAKRLEVEANANPNGEDDISVDADELTDKAGVELEPEDDYEDLG